MKKKKKENERWEKFKRREEEKRKIDEEENLYNQKQIRALNSKTRQQLFIQNDCVKALNSKLILCDVLEERDRQLEKNREKREEEMRIKKMITKKC